MKYFVLITLLSLLSACSILDVISNPFFIKGVEVAIEEVIEPAIEEETQIDLNQDGKIG